MTKYPVSYWSVSKQQDIEIEKLEDHHLLNAYRKRRDSFNEEQRDFDMLLAALWDEIQARGLNPAYPGGRPPEQETTP